MVEITAIVLSALVVFTVAVGVRFVAERTTAPYTVLLVLYGFGISTVTLITPISLPFGALLTHDTVLYLFLPAILFQGAAEIDFEAFLRNVPISASLVLVGLPIAVGLIGVIGARAFAVPLAVALLFGSMVYPVDPVAVISLYDEMGAPERLAVITEGESLIDDGLAIVVFGSLLSLVRQVGPTAETPIFTPGRLESLLSDFLVVTVGGVAVGLVVGYVTYRLQQFTDDSMTKFLLTVVAAYGSFLIGQRYLDVSGVLATVVVGLILGSAGKRYAVGQQGLEFLEHVWRATVFVLNTILFTVIGTQVPVRTFVGRFPLIVGATLVVLLARAAAVYSVTLGVNRVIDDPIPFRYRHVLVWGGLHGVIPVALALSLSPNVPYRGRLRTLVFGVVVSSIVVQGLLMPYVLRALNVVEPEERRSGGTASTADEP
ncbi:MAG: cation:proton antiporter [Salinigranum sp.]